LKRKVLAILLVAALCFVMVAACQDNTAAPAAPAPAPAAPAPEPAPAPAPAPEPAPPALEVEVEDNPFLQNLVIVNIPKSVGGAWFNRMFNGFGIYTGLTGSQTWQAGPSTGDAALQNRNIQDAIAQGVEVIAICPFAPEQSEADLQRAMEAGIIVIANEGEGMTNIHWNVDAFDAEIFAKDAASRFYEGMDGEGEVLIFVGSLGSTAHMAWAQGIVDTIEADFPNMSIANEGGIFIETGNNAALSYERAQEALLAYPHVKGVFSPSSTDNPSIALAIEEAGLIDQITFVGVGLPNAVRTYVESGALDYLLSWDPGEIGLAMCMVAGAVHAGIDIKTGDDLGVFGFRSVTVRGNSILGTEWRIISKDNIGNYFY